MSETAFALEEHLFDRSLETIVALSFALLDVFQLFGPENKEVSWSIRFRDAFGHEFLITKAPENDPLTAGGELLDREK